MADTHYTCPECQATADTPGVCTDADCLREDSALLPCQCTDGEHGADDDEDYYAR